jgi:hypothetical protein
MLGVGMALGLLLIAGLTLAALALRPREAVPTPSFLSSSVAQVEIRPASVVAPTGKEEAPAAPSKSEAAAEAPAKALEPVIRAGESPPALPQAPPASVEAARETLELLPPVEPARAPLPPPAAATVAEAKAAPAAEPDSGTCGTAVAFVGSPVQAARRAAEEGKLVFTLHVSGNFEDPGFT